MTKRNVLKWILFSSSLFGLCSCGSLVRKHDAQTVQSIKTAAVVAFTEVEPASAGIGFDLSKHKLGATAGGSLIAAQDAHTDKMFADLVDGFGNQMKWKMTPITEMTSNPGYQKAYESTMKGIQMKMPPSKGTQQYTIADVMDYDGPRILDSKGRDELIRALGVDAIIVARVQVDLEGTTIMGIGSRHPKSNLSFMVYTLGRENPAWFDGRIEGSESEESVGKTGFIDETLLGQLALKSAEVAYSKIASAATE